MRLEPHELRYSNAVLSKRKSTKWQKVRYNAFILAIKSIIDTTCFERICIKEKHYIHHYIAMKTQGD